MTSFDAANSSISDSSALTLSMHELIISSLTPSCFNLNLILEIDQPLFIKLLTLLGCMVGSSLSMMPALLLHEYADYIDLDGPCFLKQDQVDG